MEKSVLAIVLVSLGLLGACGSDSGGTKSGTSPDGGATGAGGGSSTGLPTCDATCPGVLAAKCSAGPVSQSDCVTGCEAVRASQCAAQYRALYTCGGASPKYDCTTAGQVGLVGCDAQTAALWSCLAGP
ncbi:MAG TPA: hypothetical protein VH062_21475 [Polyangiaceae bacterium]|jgi:hypothetical protein|nr:hypothetical protein [Polyangiaceae bacterium]